ncbi:MAG: bifunctional homocysteine S-methyltransferase/methylenetetrahydrofolate reductase [Planctomycetia bacterium]|nr:bifunctional homocysteine S-methyltransferase/methylenetetrahydrofolate reductase [Planctomycetia bacterium]
MTSLPTSAAALLEALQNSVVIFDGAMGTELYRNHIFTNCCFDELNLSRPDLVEKIHRSYLEAGAEVLTTNTIGANTFFLQKFGFSDKMEGINRAGVKIAQKSVSDFHAASEKNAKKQIFIAGSVGPVGVDGENHLPDDEIVSILANQIRALWDAGADFILFETQTTLRSLKLSVRAIAALAKEGKNVPFILSFRPRETDVKETPVPLHDLARDFLALLDEKAYPRPFAWGINCGLGPDEMLVPVEKCVGLLDAPLVVQPEAGRPRKVEVRSISMTSPEFFTEYAKRYISVGVRGVGGCCGIGPEHILEMARSVKPLANARLKELEFGALSPSAEEFPPKPLAERSELGRKLAEKQWVTSVELVPPRGFDLEPTVEKCRALREFGVDCINIPDGPRASCKISPLVTADRIQRGANIETILHFCSRDKNLIGMQSELLGCAACGINNILFITGDPPKLGDYPDATGVFDTDSVGLTRIQQRMNRGVDFGGKPLPKPTAAVMGVGLDPTALDRQREVDRFFRKVEAGAEFAITQPVFAPEILLEILEQVKSCNIPIIAGIWPLASYRNAFFMKTEVPGVVVPDSIMERMERHETKEAQLAEGILIAREAIEQIRSHVAGIQVSAPFGNIDIVKRVLS